ncbi:hypothetical protein K4H28_11240 [Deefgea tanakiae]|jgi:membrane protein implicated in regulation of membrane protease activity|uniref:Uncharacterized protein n=1 Tax=Deefgea tanakiae TaxID=2865840 RepID=A0ABX8Z2V0_9NEIS|nr:hypothetical protein [Deefgea tanakiae]QZA76886.1 hypothetical protein K4H28_11240 [Deefgea tanakiae]
MYILLIGYLFVVVMFAAVVGASKWALGLFFFIVLAVLPTWFIFWLQRRVQKKKIEVQVDKENKLP